METHAPELYRECPRPTRPPGAAMPRPRSDGLVRLLLLILATVPRSSDLPTLTVSAEESFDAP